MNSNSGFTIEWSEEDGAFLATFSKYPTCVTHGATPEEAMANAAEALELLEEEFGAQGAAVETASSAAGP